MSIVNYDTGEVVDAEIVDLNAREARALTDEIRQTLRVGHELIVRAYQGRAWLALGYQTWDAYCAGEFAEARMVRLDREQRQQIVADMRREGMSNRAIASGIGADYKTVMRDAQLVQDGPVAITGTDGKVRKNKPPVNAGTVTSKSVSGAGTVRSPELRRQRADVIADLAAQGYSSRQMPSKVGVTQESVRQIARDFDIEIPADKVVGRSRRIDYTAAVVSTITDLENSIEFIENQLDLSEVDFGEAEEWLSSLTNSIRALNRFKQQIKENSHV